MADSSTKKAAKLAQRGGGRTVRFQGGTVFPLAVALTLVLGLALIVYARQSVPAADASPPTIDDHWHAAYGFNICGEWYQLNGDLEELNAQGQLVNTDFLRSGVHSHNDGIIHWHPYGSPAVGKNAKLGVFLETYGVELTDDALRFPPAQVETVPGLQAEYVEGDDDCDGEDAELSVKAWDSFTDTDAGSRFIANMNNIRIDSDAMVFSIYFLPDGEEQSMPPWAQELLTRAENDSGQLRPEDLLDQTDPSIVGDPSGDSTEDGADDAPADDAPADDEG